MLTKTFVSLVEATAWLKLQRVPNTQHQSGYVRYNMHSQQLYLGKPTNLWQRHCLLSPEKASTPHHCPARDLTPSWDKQSPGPLLPQNHKSQLYLWFWTQGDVWKPYLACIWQLFWLVPVQPRWQCILYLSMGGETICCCEEPVIHKLEQAISLACFAVFYTAKMTQSTATNPAHCHKPRLKAVLGNWYCTSLLMAIQALRPEEFDQPRPAPRQDVLLAKRLHRSVGNPWEFSCLFGTGCFPGWKYMNK